jgi:hypothetical protein
VKLRPSLVVIFLIFSSSGISYYYLGLTSILALGFITTLTFLEDAMIATGLDYISIWSAFSP